MGFGTKPLKTYLRASPPVPVDFRTRREKSRGHTKVKLGSKKNHCFQYLKAGWSDDFGL